MNKEHGLDDNIAEIILGGLLISVGKFNDGILIEKIIVLLGFVFFMIGIAGTIKRYKTRNKKGIIIFLLLTFIISLAVFLGLLYRFIWA